MKAPKILAPSDVEQLLGNWELLNVDLMGLPIRGVAQLLVAEVRGRRRPQVVTRLYGRYNRLRREVELAALMRGEAWPVNHTQ